MRHAALLAASCLALACSAREKKPADPAGKPAVEGCAGAVTTQDLSFPAADGLVVHATHATCQESPRPVVVLVHQMCSDRGEWSKPAHDWQGALVTRGLATLAIDLRGHGQSRDWPDGSRHNLCEERTKEESRPLYAGMVEDVKAAAAYAARELKAPRVAVVGGSIGANSALAAFAGDASLAAVIALSPGLDYFQIKTEEAARTIGARKAYLLAAEDDKQSADATRALKGLNPALEIKVYESGGHGNKMLSGHPEELSRLAGLLVAALSPVASR
jgi:alpha-beta hydrolase superfamily lysophospholipase